MTELIQPPKFVVKHIAQSGTRFRTIVVTPPLDTLAEADVYRDWYDTEANILFRVARDKLVHDLQDSVVHHIVVSISVTQY